MSGRIVDRGAGIETITIVNFVLYKGLVKKRLFEELTMAEKRSHERRKPLLKQDTVNYSGPMVMAPVIQRLCDQDD